MKPSCERKPTASTRRKERAAHAVSLRTKRPVDVCTICLTAVIGPALRMAERRLGRYTPCGCERVCWECAYNYAMRSSLWRDDMTPIINEDDLNSKVVRCPCCNSIATSFEECSPTGASLVVASLPFRDLSAQERSTLRREPSSAWGGQVCPLPGLVAASHDVGGEGGGGGVGRGRRERRCQRCWGRLPSASSHGVRACRHRGGRVRNAHVLDEARLHQRRPVAVSRVLAFIFF